MIARVNVFLPFSLTMPENETFNIFEYVINEYKVRVCVPGISDRLGLNNEEDSIKINNVNAFNADVLHIEFQKDYFYRNKEQAIQKEEECDPPIDLIERVSNDFLNRLRYVTNGCKIKFLESPLKNWNIDYLNDDGSELKEDQELVRGRFKRNYNFSCTVLNGEVWDGVNSLGLFESLPVWKNLLLDAKALLPEVGPAIILTFTSLEVFISTTLDKVVDAGKVDKELWNWISSRGALKEPSIEDKYGFLLQYLVGVDLKEDNDIWESFKHLRKARNSFAHEGVAKVGAELVTPEKAGDFIVKAKKIIEIIRCSLPKEMQWIEFDLKPEVLFSKRFKNGNE